MAANETVKVTKAGDYEVIFGGKAVAFWPPIATPAADSKGIRDLSLWRRRESNPGAARSQESGGAPRRVVSGEESPASGDPGESASASENGPESPGCSNVANGPTLATPRQKRLDAAPGKSDEFDMVRRSRRGPGWRLTGMRHKGTERVLGIEAALRDLLRDVLRDELRHLREEMLEAIRAHDQPPPANEPNPDELLTVDQVAQALKVIPDTVRDWIQAGALRASRPGKPHAYYHVNQNGMFSVLGQSDHAALSGTALVQAKQLRYLKIGGRIFLVVGAVIDTVQLGTAGYESYQQGSAKPIAKQAVKTATGWGLAWAGAKAGIALGAAAGVETGPGMVLTAIGGGIIGGVAGYFGGNWIADWLFEN